MMAEKIAVRIELSFLITYSLPTLIDYVICRCIDPVCIYGVNNGKGDCYCDHGDK